MELIGTWEMTRRGLYGGVVGYLDFAGDADFAIAIRTALMRSGPPTSSWPVGGGRLERPLRGHTEDSNKARARAERAIAAAGPEAP